MGNPGGLPDGFFLCCESDEDCCPDVPEEGEDIPSRPPKAGSCGTATHTNGCICLLFYHPKAGESHAHTRHLALPDKSGKVKRDKNMVYEYRCVSLRLSGGGGGGGFVKICGDPVFKKDPADPMSAAQLIVCPKECSGKDCALYFSSGEKWKQVEADQDATEKKFSETQHHQLKIDPNDLDGLRKKMMFFCVCA